MLFFDLFGALCSLLSTFYFIRLNSKAWLVGLVATLINGFLYWHKGIYADMTLEGFYFLSMAYGWFKWQQKTTPFNQPTRLNQLTWRQAILIAFILCALFGLIYSILRTLTHSSVAFLDATTTSLSILAQWLMCYKIILTWVVWFLVDILYAWMYLSKQLPFHSVLMFVYVIMAISGYLVWSRSRTKL